jgi:uncharacterized repeat protein (TIGR01451 family)
MRRSKFFLTNAQNASISIGRATGTIFNDDGISGRLHHFDWSTIPDPQTQTIGFPVTITARDYYGAVATNLPWPVRLSAQTTNVIAANLDFEQPSLAPWVTFNNTPYDKPFQQVLYDVAGLGQPSTAFRTIAGGGTNGIGQNIFLAGGITYTFKINLVASMEAYDMSCLGGAAYLQVGPTNASWGLPGLCGGAARNTVTLVYTPPTNGVYPLQLIVTRDYYYGDAYAVYADDVQISYPVITPAVATNFTNGIWTGSVVALQSRTNVTLLANDGGGHKGTSNPFNILATTDLSLSGSSQTQGTPPLRTGMQLAFNLAVTNRGPAAATNTLVQSSLPANVSFVSATNSQGTVSNVAGVVRWAIGLLPKGSNATASLVVQANLPGTVTNVLSLTNSILDLNPADNLLALTNQIAQPLLSISSGSGLEAAAAATGTVFSVTTSGPSGQSVSVNYFTADGSATNGTVTFAPGATNASIKVFSIDNILNQPNRTFTLRACLETLFNRSSSSSFSSSSSILQGFSRTRRTTRTRRMPQDRVSKQTLRACFENGFMPHWPNV